MIEAAQRVVFEPSTRDQVLLICTLIGICAVLAWIIRGVVFVALCGWYLLVRTVWRAHRRGVARVKAYEAKLAR